MENKKLDELKAGDVIEIGSESRVILFTKTGKLKGYAYALLSERDSSWKIERREIRGHGHDSFAEVRGDRAFQVSGNLLNAAF